MAKTQTSIGSIASSTRYRSKRRSAKRPFRTYWAETGFLILAVLFIRPEIIKNIAVQLSGIENATGSLNRSEPEKNATVFRFNEYEAANFDVMPNQVPLSIPLGVR